MKSRLPITATVLLLLAAALGWHLKTRASKPNAAGAVPTAAVVLSVVIKKVSIRRTDGQVQLSLTAIFTQNGQAPLRLVPPLVTLLTANQTPVPRYLGPILPEPVLPGTGPTELTLHYWLPASDLSSPLNLSAGGQQHPLPAPDIVETGAR